MKSHQQLHGLRKYLRDLCCKIFPLILFMIQATRLKEVKVTEEDLQIYKKYLGNDYTPGKQYSILIANHISYIEIINNMRLGGGFVTKAELESVPVVGLIVKATEGLFINRDSKESRHQLIDQIGKRQDEMMSGVREVPLVIYPEGTISSGTHLLPLKKGAFLALHPVKPIISIPEFKNNYDLSPGAMDALDHLIISFCYFRFSFSYKVLPNIEYTEFAKKNKKDPNKSDGIEFANLTYEIMKEVGKLESSTKTYDDMKDYIKKINEYSRLNKKSK